MSSRIIEAKAVISGQDKLSGVLAGIGKKVEGLAKAIQAAGKADGLNKSLGKIDTSKIDAAKRSVDQLNKATAQTAKAVAQTAKIDTPLRGFSESLRRDIQAMQLSRTEVQKLAAAYAKMQADQNKALSGIGNAKVRQQLLDKDSAAIEGKIRDRLRRMQDLRRLETEITAPRGRVSAGAAVAGAAGAIGAGYQVRRAVRAGAEVAGAREIETARGRAVGISPEHNAIGEARARELSRQYPHIPEAELREHYRMLHVNLGGDALAARDMMDPVARAQTLLRNFRPGDQSREDLAKIIKGAENAGWSDQPEKFRNYLEGATKGMQLFGDTLRGEDYFQFAQKGKMSVPGLSPRFLGGVLPSLLDDEGGATVGQSQNTAFQTVVGGKVDKKALPEWRKYGLIGKDGRAVQRQKFIEDPDQWVRDELMPRMQKQGVDLGNLNAVADAIFPLFRDRNTANYLGKMITKRDEIAKNERRLGQVRGLNDAGQVRQENPSVALEGAQNAARGAAGDLAGPLVPAATAALNAFADAVGKVGDAARKHPDVAEKTAPSLLNAAAAGAAGLFGAGAKAVAGTAEGVGANLLRYGGKISSAAGRFLGLPGQIAVTGADLSRASAGILNANPEARASINANPMLGAMWPDGGLASAIIDAKAPGRTDPDTGRLDAATARLASARSRAQVDAGNFGTKSAIGAGRQAKHAKAIAKLESEVAAIEQTIRSKSWVDANGNLGERGAINAPGMKNVQMNAPQPPPRPTDVAPAGDASKIEPLKQAITDIGQKADEVSGKTIAPNADASKLETIKTGAEQAGQALDQVGQKTVSPTVNASSIQSAIQAVQSLLGLLGQVESKANSAAAAAGRAKAAAASANSTSFPQYEGP